METSLKRATFEDLFNKLNEVKQLNHARTEKLYIEMHVEALRDLICDPLLDGYIHMSPATIINAEKVEHVLGCRIFTHEDSSKRFVVTITYRTDVLMGDKTD